MKKFLLSVLVLGIFIIYALHTRIGNDEAAPVVAINSPNTSPPQNPVATNGSVSTSSGKYKDGTFVGSVADAFYGNIQVQVVITGGKITDVIFLQSPSDRGTSIEINSQAMPLLKQEAIQAQSAQVDGVSGATASSGAFIQSLQSALKQAV
jgi:uncharacterized protein with FMN-binding domain